MKNRIDSLPHGFVLNSSPLMGEGQGEGGIPLSLTPSRQGRENYNDLCG